MGKNFAVKMVASTSIAIGLILATTPIPAVSAIDTLSEGQVALWVEDLEYLAENLPSRHYDAFNSTSESEFNAQVELLKGQIPSLTEDELVIGISKLVSLVKDSHTTIDVYHHATRFYPLQVGYFVGEGPQVLAVQAGFDQAFLQS